MSSVHLDVVCWVLVFVFKLQVDTKNVVKRNLLARIQFFSRCVRGCFVGLIRDSCRECLLVQVVGGGGMPWVKRLGYCAGSKNSNSENWTCP